jgi:hypothetical protein
MKQARTAPRTAGTFGLAAPSLLAFHLADPALPGPRRAPRLRAARHKAKPALRGDLDGAGDPCSKLEREAESAERELLDWKKVKFLRGREGEEFAGVSPGWRGSGLRATRRRHREGCAHRAAGAEWFEFDPVRHELRGSATGASSSRRRDARARGARRRVLRRVDLAPIVEREPAARRERSPAAAKADSIGSKEVSTERRPGVTLVMHGRRRHEEERKGTVAADIMSKNVICVMKDADLRDLGKLFSGKESPGAR